MWRALQMTLLTVAVAGGLVLGCGERPGEREFQNALRQFERGNLVRAKDLFEKSINKRPGHETNAFAHQYIGYIAWQLEDATAAVAHFENARRLHPHLYEAVYSLAVIAYREGDPTRARSLFGEAAQLRPNEPRPLEYIARIHAEAGNRREARRTLFEALSRAPQSARILTSLALLEFEELGPAAAVSYLMQALENNPNYLPALYNLGRAYAHWPEERAHAVEYFNEYLAQAPPGPQRDRAQRLLLRLEAGEPLDDEDDIAEAHAEPDEREPPDAPPPRTLDDVLRNARELAEAGQLEQAISVCLRAAIQANQRQRPDQEERALRAAVELAPESARAQLALGRHLAARDQHREALASLQRANALEPEWSHVLIALADSAAELDDYDVALDALNRAVDLVPNDPNPLWSLAELYDEAGVRRPAIDAYRRFREQFAGDPRAARAAERMEALQPVAEVRPDEPTPRPPPTREAIRNVQAAREAFDRGVSYQQRRDWDSAIYFYQRAVENDPTLERAHYNMGLIQYERRNLREAREAFGRSVDLEPNKVAARYNLALVLYELDETDAARPHLDAALREDPNFAAAHLLLGAIYADEQGTRDRARRHYERFLALQPNDPNAPAVREWLAQN